MKILVIHNFYRSNAPSGENQAVNEHIEALQNQGHEIETFFRHSDSIKNLKDKIFTGFSLIFNIKTLFELRKKVLQSTPDIIHIHNTFPLISLSVLFLFNIKKKIPIFMTFHNFRFFCINGTLTRNSRVCTKCIDNNNQIFSLQYRCYKSSLIQSLPLYISNLINKKFKIIDKRINKYIALNDFQKNMLVKAGLDESKIEIINNPLSINIFEIEKKQDKNFILYVGRVSEEKGVINLIKLISDLKKTCKTVPELVVIGGGVLKNEAESLAKKLDVNAKFCGNIERNKISYYYSRCSFLVIPSLCFEGLPMTFIEGLYHGAPMAVSNLGAMKGLTEQYKLGVTFDPFNKEESIKQLKKMCSNSELRLSSSNNAFKASSIFSQENFTKKLLNSYDLEVKKIHR